MPRNNQYPFANKLVTKFVFLIICLCFVLTGDLCAQSDSPSSGVVRSVTVTIDDKTEDAVISGERRFVVTKSTTIINRYGKRIKLNRLSLPVEAEVRYKLMMDQDPLCLRIVIK